MTQLLVNEIFETIQGEGSFTGTPSIFIRLQGCPVGCSWCDTKHTWETLEKDEQSPNVILQKRIDSPAYFKTSSMELIELIFSQGYSARHIVITGGEPCMFDLNELSAGFIDNHYSVQIETSGTFEIKTHPETWVTLSPKINMKSGMPVLHSTVLRANEIKHPVAMQKHIDELDTLLQDVKQKFNLDDRVANLPLVYLQPISQLERATSLAVETCIKRNWRLSVQLHKYIGVD